MEKLKLFTIVMTIATIIFTITVPIDGQAADEVFGIYTNLNADSADTTIVGVGEMYLCLKNMSRSTGVSGWECLVILSVGGTVGSKVWTYEGDGSNAFDPLTTSKFDVTVGTGLSALVPVGDIVHLATFSCFLIDETSNVRFSIRPLTDSVTFVDAPGYHDKDDLNVHYAVGNSSGGAPGDTGSAWWPMCGAINYGAVISETSSTWSGVKALFK